MKNLWWFVAIGAVLWIGATARAAVLAPLSTAFKATGAKPVGYSLNAWVKVPKSEAHKSLESLITTVSQKAHVRGTLQHTSGTGYQKEAISTSVAGIDTKCIVERLKSGATFVVLDRTSAQGFQALTASEDVFRSVLTHYGHPHMSVNLEGRLRGRLTPKARAALIGRAMGAVGASRVNGVNTVGYAAVAGSTALIHESDNLEGHAVNLQVAVAYNTYHHATQVYVGSPLITVTY